MPLAVVYDNDSVGVERIRQALASEGWTIQVIVSPADLGSISAAEAPALFIVNAALDGGAELLRRYARRVGGPGSVALVNSGSESRASGADEMLTMPFSTDALKKVAENLRGRLAAVGDSKAPVPRKERKLTSKDIFGDLLAEVGDLRSTEAESPAIELESQRVAAELGPVLPPDATPTALPELELPKSAVPEKPIEVAPPAASPSPRTRIPRTFSIDDEIEAALPKPRRPLSGSHADQDRSLEKRLEKTLSGLVGKRPTADQPSARRPSREELDEILDRTLSGIGVAALRRDRSPSPRVETATPLQSRESKTPTSAVVSSPNAMETQRIEVFADAGQPFGQYVLLQRIALGGMAEVWKARQTGVEGFRKTVAIKKILPHLTADGNFVRMFIDEAKLAAQLSHAAITTIFDFGKIDNDYFIAMEFVDGPTLRAVLDAARKRGRRLPVAQSIKIAAALAGALDYAHRKRDFEDRPLGIVHRDVSPQNVLISREGDIKLCDFGISKAVVSDGYTMMGALKGKLQYMSPEQAWGRDVDHRSDIFSLGALLYEMLTGRRLFTGDSELAVLEAVRECLVLSPRVIDPLIPQGAADLVLKALAKEPQDRFESASDFERRLDDILSKSDLKANKADLAGMVNLFLDEEDEASTPPTGSYAAPEERTPVEGISKVQFEAAEEATRLESGRAAAAQDEVPVGALPAKKAEEAAAIDLGALLTRPTSPGAEQATAQAPVSDEAVPAVQPAEAIAKEMRQAIEVATAAPPPIQRSAEEEAALAAEPFTQYGDDVDRKRVRWLWFVIGLILVVVCGLWFLLGGGAERLGLGQFSLQPGAVEPPPTTVPSVVQEPAQTGPGPLVTEEDEGIEFDAVGVEGTTTEILSGAEAPAP